MSMLKGLFQRSKRQDIVDTRKTVESQKQILFIFGCQRSGTTITSNILGKLNYVKSYAEVNTEITDQDTEEGDLHTIRLNPLEDVKQKLLARPEPIVVVKPLVESQYASKILDYFPNSRALWMYRNPQDTVSSLIKLFGARTKKRVFYRMIGEKDNWRAEGITDELRETLSQFAGDELTIPDAWGLFWYARNSLFFSQSLQDDQRIVLVKYQKLVQQKDYLESVLNRLEISTPGLEYVWDYHEKSVGQGKEIKVSDSVRVLLDEMLNKLDKAELNQWQ